MADDRPARHRFEGLAQAKIEAGPVFRRIDQWGSIDRRPLTPQSITPPKGRPGAGQVPGAWVAVRLSDRGSHTPGAAAGGDAAVAVQVNQSGCIALKQPRIPAFFAFDPCKYGVKLCKYKGEARRLYAVSSARLAVLAAATMFSSTEISSSVRSVSGARTEPGSRPITFSPALMIETA